MDDPFGQVNVAPFQPQQLPAPEAGGEVDVVQLEHAAVSGFLEEGAQALRRQDLHLLLLQLRQNTALCGIGGDQVLFHGTVQGRGDHLVDVSHRLDTEALGLATGLCAFQPAVFQKMLVQALEIH